MPELTVPTHRQVVDLVPITAASLLLALGGAHFERQFITVSAVGPIYTWPLCVAIARDVLIVLFMVACWFAASTGAKWARIAVWCLPIALIGVMVVQPALDVFINELNGPAVIIGLWWSATFCLACLFSRANRWAGRLMVPHVVYATYVSLAVCLTWGKG